VPDLGSADSARINMDYYELNNPVFAVQGDNIFDIKVKSLIDFHKEKCSCLTIVLREVDNVEGLGIADIDKNGRIQRFVEKPMPKDAPQPANTGHILSPEVKDFYSAFNK
jgi:NDP-sugar pyrophosphorylase family protein